MSKRVKIAAAAFFCYCAVMLWLLFGQRMGAGAGYPARLGENINLLPFKTITEFVIMAKDGQPGPARHAFINLAGNVAMFIPLGFLPPCIWPGLRPPRRLLACAAAAILAVEAAQLFTLLGSCDIDDLMLNLLGAAIGYGLFRLAEKGRAGMKNKGGKTMAVSNIKAVFDCDIGRVWQIVTSLEQYGWRSDLGRIEVTGQGRFVEYTKDGWPTYFTVTACEPHKRWEFDMENDNMKGHWTGVFTEREGRAEIDFTESVSAKKLWMKPFVRAYLKRQQAAYIADLRKALER